MIFNTVSGSGNSISTTKGTIIVSAPTGSVVTCANGDVIKSATEQNGKWMFTGLDMGIWTVTASLDGESKSEEVTLEQPSIEYVTLEYKVYLYRNGVAENDDITGGWESKGLVHGDIGGSAWTVTQYNGYTMLTQNASRGGGMYKTVNPVDLTNVNTISFLGILEADGDTRDRICAFRVDSVIPANGNSGSAAEVSSNAGESQKVHKLDVSSLVGNYYIYFTGQYSSCSVKIIDLYME